MLKKSASSVLASFRSSTYPRGYASGPSLAAALLDGLFEHPAEVFSCCAPRAFRRPKIGVRSSEHFSLQSSAFRPPRLSRRRASLSSRARDSLPPASTALAIFLLYSLIAGEVSYDAGGSSCPSKKFWVLDETSDSSRFSRKSRANSEIRFTNADEHR
jgi:hypothetical protein